MIRTRVGYAGGTTMNPTYRNMGDHTETLEIDFDPTIISFEQILQLFWSSHNPTRGQSYGGRQYMSLLLYHNDHQKELAKKTKEEQERFIKAEIQTEVSPYAKFYLAEDYHQKYYLKRHKNAIEQLNRLFQTEEAFTDATLTARLNGLVKGYLTMDQLKTEIDEWDIGIENVKVLKDLVNQIRW